MADLSGAAKSSLPFPGPTLCISDAAPSEKTVQTVQSQGEINVVSNVDKFEHSPLSFPKAADIQSSLIRCDGHTNFTPTDSPSAEKIAQGWRFDDLVDGGGPSGLPEAVNTEANRQHPSLTKSKHAPNPTLTPTGPRSANPVDAAVSASHEGVDQHDAELVPRTPTTPELRHSQKLKSQQGVVKYVAEVSDSNGPMIGTDFDFDEAARILINSEIPRERAEQAIEANLRLLDIYDTAAGSLHAVRKLIVNEGLMSNVPGGEVEFIKRSSWATSEPVILRYSQNERRKEEWGKLIQKIWDTAWEKHFEGLWPKVPSQHLVSGIRYLAVEGFRPHTVSAAVELAVKSRIKTCRRGGRRGRAMTPIDVKKGTVLLETCVTKLDRQGSERFEIPVDVLKRVWKEMESNPNLAELTRKGRKGRATGKVKGRDLEGPREKVSEGEGQQTEDEAGDGTDREDEYVDMDAEDNTLTGVRVYYNEDEEMQDAVDKQLLGMLDILGA